jgi:hypothetical protein
MNPQATVSVSWPYISIFASIKCGRKVQSCRLAASASHVVRGEFRHLWAILGYSMWTYLFSPESIALSRMISTCGRAILPCLQIFRIQFTDTWPMWRIEFRICGASAGIYDFHFEVDNMGKTQSCTTRQNLRKMANAVGVQTFETGRIGCAAGWWRWRWRAEVMHSEQGCCLWVHGMPVFEAPFSGSVYT